MSEESTNQPSHPYEPPSPPHLSPPQSPNYGRFYYYEAQQQHLQQQMDNLAAQMAANYYGMYDPPYVPSDISTTYTTQFPGTSSYYRSPSPPLERDERDEPRHRRGNSRQRSRSSSESRSTTSSHRHSRRGPYDERTSRHERRMRTRSPIYHRVHSPPIIIQQNIPASHAGEHPDVAARLTRLEEMVTGPHPETTGKSSPFTDLLEAGQIDLGVKVTGLESFDGTTDPGDHLSYYENLMICHRHNDLTKCRLFVSTFRAYARTWFSTLPPRSIDSWNTFKEMFLAKFRVNTPHAVHTISLENVKQNPGESPRDYIQKFKTAALKVKDLRPSNAVDSFIRNMNYKECKDCCKELCNKEPRDEAYNIASTYIATDERIRAYYPTSRGESSNLQAMQVDGMDDFRRPADPLRDRRAPLRQVREEPRFTPLNQTPTFILDKVWGLEFFQKPTPMRTPADKRDGSRFCQYHERVGHNTDECISLKHFIERMIKKGLLRSSKAHEKICLFLPPNNRKRRKPNM